MNVVMKFLGRKAIQAILGPAISGLLMTLNAVLPEGVRFTPEQMANIVEWIIGSFTALVAGQSIHDAVKGSSTAGTVKPSVPAAPALPASDSIGTPTFG